MHPGIAILFAAADVQPNACLPCRDRICDGTNHNNSTLEENL